MEVNEEDRRIGRGCNCVKDSRYFKDCIGEDEVEQQREVAEYNAGG